MIKAIAWDIDGTLVDSEPLHLYALKEVCRAYCVDISDLEDNRFVGVHMGDVWRELQPRFPSTTKFAHWARQIGAAYARNAHRLVEIPNASEVVRKIATMGLCQIAVSNSNRSVVDTNLSAIGIADYLAPGISLDDVCEGKPDPFPYRLACAKLAVDPREVLAVEDSATGAASALAAGLTVAHLHAPDNCAGIDATPISHLSEVIELAATIRK